MKDKLKSAMKEALKAKDKVRLDTIRSLLSAIQYEEMQQNKDSLSDDAVLAVLKRELKRRKEELDFAKQSGREDLIKELELQIKAVEEFLPEQLDSNTLEKIVAEIVSSQESPSIGSVMKTLKEKYSGQYDARLASELVRKTLQ
ncbi:MAG: GatB/YqeY domain-containing protein [Candidatus Dadabacteria bacterium]|nr:MAG: GatB/YqeY domain-containing protein [Candidatus Dadabacteria bacterium]